MLWAGLYFDCTLFIDEAKSGYRLRVKIWGRAYGIPRIVHIRVGDKRKSSWNGVGPRKKLIC
jgi:hypothetical protein